MIKFIGITNKKILFVLFLIISQAGYAFNIQTSKEDSLKNLLSNASSDSNRLTLMGELVDELISSDLQEAINYSKQSLELSLKLGDKEKEALARYNLGLTLYESEQRSSSLAYIKQSEKMFEALGLKELQVRNLMEIARYYRYADADSTNTVKYFFKSVEVSKSFNYNWGLARSYAKLGSFYTKYNEIDLCEKYLALSAKYYLKNGNDGSTIAHYYTEVGDKLWDTNPNKSMDLYFKAKEYYTTPNLMVSLAKAYSYTGDSQTALNYLEEAIPYFRKTEQRKRMLGTAIAQLAEVYIQLGNYASANKSCDEGLELLKNLGRSDQKALPALYMVKGLIMEHEKNEDLALKYFTKSHDEAIRVKYGYQRVNSLLVKGIFYLSRDLKKSKKACQRSYRDAKRRKYTNLEVAACDCLYEISKKEGSYLEALNYHEEKILLTDSLSTKKIEHSLEINKKIAEKDMQLAEQSYQKKINDEELKSQYFINTVLLLSTLFGLLLIGLLTINHRRIKRQNKEINEKTDELVKANHRLELSNQELERFAHVTSHDLKSPLRNIVSFTGLLRHRLKKQEDHKANELLGYIETSGKRMNELIEDVLEFSQLSNNPTKEKEIIDLKSLIKELAKLQQDTWDLKHVTFDVAELPYLKWYYLKIFQLFKNIIENGIKYNKSADPKIKIYCSNSPEIHSIYIEDNGIGIEKEYFDKIFIMFNRLHNNSEYEGTGLGLATCKKIVEEFEGKINITSVLNKGSIFKIDIPNHLIHETVGKERLMPT